MTDQKQTLREDIAFMRELAQAGASGPLAGGPILLAAGLIYAGASLTTWYAIEHHLITNGIFFPILWFGATAVFLGCLFVLKRGLPRTAGLSRAQGLAFSGSGWVIGPIVLSLMLIASRSGAWWLMGAAAPIILSIYGGAWVVAAGVSGRRWPGVVAAGSFVMAGLCAWFALDPKVQFLAYAVSLLAVLAAPGLYLMHQARKAA
jgi:hypothetical protein